MPRDLSAEISSTMALTESPESNITFEFGALAEKDTSTDSSQDKTTAGGVEGGRDRIHPFVRALTLEDLESCFIYRLNKCAELSLGLFAIAAPGSALNNAGTAASASPADSATPERKEVLLAHILATKLEGELVTEESMLVPQDPNPTNAGHREEGRTIGLHSLAVLRAYQGRGLGKTILTSYIQRMAAAGLADRISLLCEDELIKFYEKAGFVCKGKSKNNFGGSLTVLITMKTTWKDIAPVPTSAEFLDIVLSRTQRRLPTQIRAGFKIARIRNFYTRKVKFTQETFCEKLSAILDGFPRLQDIHPFHKDLLNTLYDADHFRIALGQLSTAKHLIETVSRDYVRLLKYAQSLFQCKQLKRAALGRMATITRRLKDPLLYLEQVRQHLGRLPSIDPNTRTLLICGYPNVGKSSFLRGVTRADVDVQPYAFTTKSLFVGHFDYKYLRFQAIDTPGILDHPLEEMNTIEMQSITAIAHLRSAILYFMDLSEQCGYSVASQIKLFQSIKPLFSNKLVFIVVNKIDITRPEDLDGETQEQLQGLLKTGDIELLQLSCTTNEGVMDVRNAACERLIADRVAQKLKAGTNSSGTVGGRLGDLLTRIHVAQPLDGLQREVFIPDAVKNRKRYDKSDPARRRLETDIQEEEGGAGVYNVDMKKNYVLDDEGWKHDKIPEFLNGKNVYDFVDPDIEAKLAVLEEEEEKLEAEGFYDSDEILEDAEEADVRAKAQVIRDRRQLIRNAAKMKKSLKNRAIIPRPAATKKLSDMENHLGSIGLDASSIAARARSRSRGRALSRGAGNSTEAMDIDASSNPREVALSRARSRAKSQTNRREDGVTDTTARNKAERLAKLGQKKMNRMARQGEADRHTTSALPKHLFSGKRGMGKTQRR
ncbi:MAG: Nucleolar GTP-binding protein 1 [Sarcosagium campestre]|nr:MAG: Nucleolar GTP-binding protein 1 [Sarcosagium campestre]